MDEVLAPAVATRNQSLLIALGCVLALAGVLYLVLSGLLRPLNSLSRAMSYLSSGSGDLTRRMEVTSQDEIGKVAEAFNANVAAAQAALNAFIVATPDAAIEAITSAAGGCSLPQPVSSRIPASAAKYNFIHKPPCPAHASYAISGA